MIQSLDSTLQLQRQQLEQARATINNLLSQRDAICNERKEAETQFKTAMQQIENWSRECDSMCRTIRNQRIEAGEEIIPSNNAKLLVDEIKRQALEILSIIRENAELQIANAELVDKLDIAISQTIETSGQQAASESNEAASESNDLSTAATFKNAWDTLQQDVHNNALSKGWWDAPERSTAECIALMHSELSEALEADRHGNPSDDKIPAYSGLEAELADVVIRIMDFAGRKNLRLAEAIVTKAAFNKTRPHKHGKKY